MANGLRARWDNAQTKQRSRPDTWFNRYLMVAVCYGLLVYCVYVYVAEACLPMLRRDDDARGSRSQAIIYLVFFSVLWLVLVYTYTLIVFTPPGNARKYVEKTPCPEPPFPIPTSEPLQPPKPAFIPFQRHDDVTANLPSQTPEAGAPRLIGQMPSPANPLHQQELADAHGTTAVFGTAVANTFRDASGTLGSSYSATSDATAVEADPAQTIHPGTESLVKPHASKAVDTGQPRINPKLKREVPLSGPLHPYLLYCNKCEIVKPPRTHHCRRCGTCILNMDHHCPWVGGCVGAHNHIYFFAFCFWACITLGYVFLTLLVTLVPPNVSPRPPINVQILVICVLAFILSFFTGSMTVTHWRLIILNQSTIESMSIADMKHLETLRINKEYKIFDLKEKRAVTKEFDKEWGNVNKEGNIWWLGSKRKNWTTVMGKKVIAWFVPPPRYRPDDGLHYAVNPRRGQDGKWLPRSQWPEELR